MNSCCSLTCLIFNLHRDAHMQIVFSILLQQPFYPSLSTFFCFLPPQTLSLFSCFADLFSSVSSITHQSSPVSSSFVDLLFNFPSPHAGPQPASKHTHTCFPLKTFPEAVNQRMRADAGVIVHGEHTKGSSSPDSHSD